MRLWRVKIYTLLKFPLPASHPKKAVVVPENYTKFRSRIGDVFQKLFNTNKQNIATMAREFSEPMSG